jgi:solute carrier family 25 carnitine/acylcarnitine transporter 20/29
MRNIPGTILYFYSYESLRHMFEKHSLSGELSPLSIITAGGVSGMVFWTSIFPFDVVSALCKKIQLLSI